MHVSAKGRPIPLRRIESSVLRVLAVAALALIPASLYFHEVI